MSELPSVHIHIRHIRKANLCASGTRDWFKAQGWSWPEFLANGRPSEDFIATGDPLARRVVEAAALEQKHGR